MKLFILSYALISFFAFSAISNFDVTIVGEMKFSESLARFPIVLIDTLKDDLKVNFIFSRPYIQPSFEDVPLEVQQVAKDPDKTPGKVSILCDLLWTKHIYPAKLVPQSPIKVAYSMLESTAIPKQWVQILNSRFDAVVVPDEFLVRVYKRSGVQIPIFVIPNSLYLDDFLSQPIKSKKNEPFTFGVSGTFYPHKNLELLVKAFIKEFGNNPQVQLKVHARRKDYNSIERTLKQMIKATHSENIKLIRKRLTSQEYVTFLASLDCYVFLSKGEGFSITPREAMALGIPCILSRNTAHITICNSGLVYPVYCPLIEPAFYHSFNGQVGYQFNCRIEDVRRAMRRVYENYDHYLNQAMQERAWAAQYSYQNIKNKYVTLVKPQKVVFGHVNEIKENYIITNSLRLYKKYYEHVIHQNIERAYKEEKSGLKEEGIAPQEALPVLFNNTSANKENGDVYTS